MIKKLLSLPPHLAECFHQLTQNNADEYFCSHDPLNHRLGSGGGTVWLLNRCFNSQRETADFDEWLGQEKRILIHAGGHSRRLPAYAPSGKVLIPLPVFRWERGQKIGQTLLDLQLPLYEQMIRTAPDSLHTMIVSGDVYIRTTQPLPQIPQADVVCFGIWLDAEIAKNHGVFICDRNSPDVLKKMLQKPQPEVLKGLAQQNLFLTDIGLWFLSDKAVRLLAQRSCDNNGNWKEYDLYSQFGRALGTHPDIDDRLLNELTVAVLPLDGGEFYHFGTSREMISSTVKLQNVQDNQRLIIHHDRKPHPAIFVQNAVTQIEFKGHNSNVWIENSFVPHTWTISSDNVITGVPENHWNLKFNPGQCLDIVPVDERFFAVRTYNINDRFDGENQQLRIFPVVDAQHLQQAVEAMMEDRPLDECHVQRMMSADELANEANLFRLFEQREKFLSAGCRKMAENWRYSVFYQTDLNDMAGIYKHQGLQMPSPLPYDAPRMLRICDAMFRGDNNKAFALLRQTIVEPMMEKKQNPQLAAQPDQIIWGRSPVRIDIAGGWTDTPPYCLLEGGAVVNLAIELNGQPPLQVYVKPSDQPHIVLRSIDLGAQENITSFEQIKQFNVVGNPFSIPKAALFLAGFHPDTCCHSFASLADQLNAFGGGIELTLFSAVPSGSGLGTSSILAATVLGTLSEFASLGWTKQDICHRTFVLEQMLTTGGGWQDQFGGVMGGVKSLATSSGFVQFPKVRWLPESVFTSSDAEPCHLLFYTGIRRTAKDILADIVRRMFLNEHNQLLLLRQMKEHAMIMSEAIQMQDFHAMGMLMRHTWTQNQMIDPGTNPPEIQRISALIDDLCLGYKLPGAGGGGYMYMMAKDPEAAIRIRHILNENRSNPNARFVNMSISRKGMEITRS